MTQNIVLIGMPCSGKSTVGRILAERLKRALVETDEEIVGRANMPITEIFRLHGESFFRDLEADAVHGAARLADGRVISTGGGSVLRRSNVAALRRTGLVIFLDRPLDDLLPTEDRPTANSVEKIRELHRTRLPLYTAAADFRVSVTGTPDDVADRILGILACASCSAS